MIDHVGLRVTDMDATVRFYETLLAPLGIERDYTSDSLVEWGDLAISPPEEDRPVTRGLHLAFVAPAGYADAGAVLLDPDGNRAEAVHHDEVRTNGVIDHVWIRVADVAASRDFYSRIPGLSLESDSPEHVRFATGGGALSLVADDGSGLTENLHLAIAGTEDDVRAFHAASTGAGYRDNGAPGFRPEYHEGYYGAFVLDPDGNNIEVVDHHR